MLPTAARLDIDNCTTNRISSRRHDLVNLKEPRRSPTNLLHDRSISERLLFSFTIDTANRISILRLEATRLIFRIHLEVV